MGFLSMIRRLQWRLGRRSAKVVEKPSTRPSLETLEDRVVPAAPTVVATIAPAGVSDPITVIFSEDVIGADNIANYSLFDSAGVTATITNVAYTNTGTTDPLNPFEATITLDTNLPAGNYTLFVRGDGIFAVDDNTPISGPGQLVVANNSSGSISTVSMLGDGVLGALSNYPVPPTGGGTASTPSALAMGDIDGDSILDLVVASGGSDRLAVYLGDGAGEFQSSPTVFSLPAGADPSGLVLADFNTDGTLDIAVANRGTSNVTIFNNTSTIGAVGLSSTNVAVGVNPTGLVAGYFNTDGRIDLATSNSGLTGTDYNVSILSNTSGGIGISFALTNIIVGTSAPLNLTSPSSIAVGDFDGDFLDDLVVGGTSGLSILTNTSTGTTPSFAITNPGTTGVITPITSVATGNYRSNAGFNPTDDILAISGTNLIGLINNGVGAFSALGIQSGSISAAAGAAGVNILITSASHGLQTGQTVTIRGVAAFAAANGTFTITVVDANSFRLNGTTGVTGTGTANTGNWSRTVQNIPTNVATPTALTMWDLNPNNNFSEILFTNGAAAGGVVSRSHLQAGFVEDAVSTATETTITSTAHGLKDGQQVVLAGVAGNPDAIGTFFITNVTANTFELVGTPLGTLDATDDTGTWVALANVVTNVTKPLANSSIRVTVPNHGLVTGQRVTIAGVVGAVEANGTFFIHRIDDDTFELNGTEGTTLSGAYTLYSGSVTLDPYLTGQTPVALALGDTDGDGVDDLVTANRAGATVSYYRGSDSIFPGDGDGTFHDADTQLLVGTSPRPLDVHAGDINQDGIKDLVVLNSFAGQISGQVQIFIGLANGGYRDPVTVSTGTNARSLSSIALGDVDNDGDLDIVGVGTGVSSFDRTSVVLINTTTPLSTTPTFLAPTTTPIRTSPTEVKLADFNKDGRLDMIIGHNGGPGNRGVDVRLGNGAGSFTSIIAPGDPLLLSNSLVTALAVGDFNNDGNLDFAATDFGGFFNPSSVRIMLGDGANDGVLDFISPANGTIFGVGSQPVDLVTSDLDLDGFSDLIVVSGSSFANRPLTVLRNNNGAFSVQSGATPQIPNGVPLQSLAVAYLNDDPFPDLIFTSGPVSPNPQFNVQVLLGVGGAAFTSDIDPYSIGGTGSTVLLPSFVNVVNDPFISLLTFAKGGAIVNPNLLKNHDFESFDLAGETGSLLGWNTYKLAAPSDGSVGGWSVQTGVRSPLSYTRINPAPSSPNGFYMAMLDQADQQPYQGGFNPNDADTYSGTHLLYQDVFIPPTATEITLSLDLYLNSEARFINPASNPTLDHRNPNNQQVRVDLVDPSQSGGNILTVGPGILDTVFVTDENTLGFFGGEDTVYLNPTLDVSKYAGKVVRLRIASVNNLGKLIVGVDNVQFKARFSDDEAPQISGLRLRNVSYLSGPNIAEQSPDITIVGNVSDNGGVENIRYVRFDMNNDGFGGFDDLIVSTFDADGNFSLTVPNTLLGGYVTVPIEIVDWAGQTSSQNYTFIKQTPSLATWEAVGPNSVDISSEDLDYRTVSGKITAVVADLSDPTGNTLYIGAANGGVWKSVNGGHDWQSTTDNVLDALGNPVHVAVGSMTMASDGTIYVATGVDDNALTSRTGVGVLKSTDGGRNWTVTGAAEMTGARISKIVVAENDPNVVYVSVSSFNDPTKQPAVFKTTNGGLTWVNVLNPQTNMFDPNSATPLGNVPLASVTDMIIDPFAPNRVFIGLGNVRQVPASDTAGLWFSFDGGATWNKKVGGDSLALAGNPTPETQGFLPSGVGVGRMTLAQSAGSVNGQAVLYVLISNPPPGTYLQSPLSQGTTQGLYKTRDNMDTFTKVMLKEQYSTAPAHNNQDWRDIGLLAREGATAGALVVDPYNPHVVYVGGSRWIQFPGDNLSHALIRVDTSNMRDSTYFDLRTNSIPNDGDDIDKEAASTGTPRRYPSRTLPDNTVVPGALYTGEGVSWYDVEQAVSHGTDSFTSTLPQSIKTLAFDGLGRLLIGTENGIFRGVPRSFGYDFLSGGSGILGIFPNNYNSIRPVGMDITDLNGNLEIGDLTSIALDLADPSSMFVTSAGWGSAFYDSATNTWFTNGLRGPGGDISNAFQVATITPAPGAPAGSTSTVYRVWQNGGGPTLQLQVSTDSGISFTVTPDAIPDTATAGLAPVLAVNNSKRELNGQFYDEFLFGVDRVYQTPTSGNVMDAISPRLSATGFISALAIAPSMAGVYYAGTDDGKVFFKDAVNNWVNRTSNLPVSPGMRIAGLTVDPTSPSTVYAVLHGTGLSSYVWKSTDSGLTWTPFSGANPGNPGSLALVNAHVLQIDNRSQPNSPNGIIYVGNEVGIFATTDNGATWFKFGQGLPTVPVMSISIDTNTETLAIATQGRGAFTLSTAQKGPYVTATTPDGPSDGSLSEATVTFNRSVDPRTFNTDANASARESIISELLSSATEGTWYRVNRVGDIIQQYLRRSMTGPEAANQATLALPNGDAFFISIILSEGEYYSNPTFGGNNDVDTWINAIYQDLYGRPPAPGEAASTKATLTNLTLSNPANVARRLVVQQLMDNDEYRQQLVASQFDKYLNRRYLADGPSSWNTTEITNEVTVLKDGGTLQDVVANILSLREVYGTQGSYVSTPNGTNASTVVFGNFTGAVDGFGIPILDMAVGLAGTNQILIYKGKAGGGYDASSPITLLLPPGADPIAMVAADFNGDGKLDLAVANREGTTVGANSVSVFLNNRAAVGDLNGTDFARTDFNGGQKPTALLVADIDGDANLDLITLNGEAVAGNWFVNVLRGTGTGTFNAPNTVLIGDTTPTGAQLDKPTDIAIGNVIGDVRPDLVVSADNGVAVFGGNSTPGTIAFTPPTSKLTSAPTTSVAIGQFDSKAPLDIVATDAVNPQVIVFRNDGGGAFVSSTFASGSNPRDVKAVDLNKDGLDDIVVANAVAQGSISILLNRTQPTLTLTADTIAFAPPDTYLTRGISPTAFALGDFNQDGSIDVGVANSNGSLVSMMEGANPGYLRTASDNLWLENVYLEMFRAQVNFNQMKFWGDKLRERSQSYLSWSFQYTDYSQGGVVVDFVSSVSPESITSTDALNTVYSLTFPLQVKDSGFNLVVGPSLLPNSLAKVISDFTDQDGTYLNVGNPMNQNQNLIDGEFPADRFTATYVLDNTDVGRYVSALYRDFMGFDATNGASPAPQVFLNNLAFLANARVLALGTVSQNSVIASRSVIVNDLYQRYLGRNATVGEVNFWTDPATLANYTYEDMVALLLANEKLPMASNAAWVEQIYQDLLGRTSVGDPYAAVAIGQLNANQVSRFAVARFLLLGEEGTRFYISRFWMQYLGHKPNQETGVDEIAFWVKTIQAQAKATATTPSGMESMLGGIFASSEYIAKNGGTDIGWSRAIYRDLFRVTPNETELQALVTSVLDGYQTQRTQIAGFPEILGGVLYTQEARARFIDRYYVEGYGRRATAAELAAGESIYQSSSQRLETVQANILGAEAFLLANNITQNPAWLNLVYQKLLGRTANSGTSTQIAEAQQRLALLNSSGTGASLVAARTSVAYSILNSTEYRTRLIASFYTRYLGRTGTAGEINFWVNRMNTFGDTQEFVLKTLAGTSEYFLVPRTFS